MPEYKKVIEVVKEWVEKAENDLKAAGQILKAGTDCPTDTVCFHAQQAVEKYLKALLVYKNIDFPKTHDIEEIMALLPKMFQSLLSHEEQGILTNYATITRYPGNYERISFSEAQHTVVIAKRACVAMTKLLPKEALVVQTRQIKP